MNSLRQQIIEKAAAMALMGRQAANQNQPELAKAYSECAETTLSLYASAPDDHVTGHKALTDVLTERARQDQRWGQQNHDPITYLAILTEEVGEFARCAIEGRFQGSVHVALGLRTEAVQVAAVALAIVEALDRGKWRWPDRRNTPDQPPTKIVDDCVVGPVSVA